MLSIDIKSGLSRADAADVAAYPDNQIADPERIEDYYAGGRQELPAQWFGLGAARLNLIGRPQQQEVVNILQGYDPRSGKALIKAAGAARTYGLDLCWSAPKSVSVCWAAGDQDARKRIEAAMLTAAGRAMQYAEEHLWKSRAGHNTRETQKGEMLAAGWLHGSSRAGDPQLHVHALTMAMAYRESEDRWTGADMRDVFRQQNPKLLAALFRSELAREMTALGYEIEARDAAGKKFAGFGIRGISREIETAFSKRKQQIDAQTPVGAGREQRRAAVMATRAPKAEISPAELRERWRQEAAGLGLTEAPRAAEASRDAGGGIDREKLLARLTEHESVFSQASAMAAIADMAPGLSIPEIEQQFAELKSGLIELGSPDGKRTVYTTPELYELEQGIIRSATKRMRETSASLAQVELDRTFAQFQVERGFALSAEQQSFVRALSQEAGGCRIGIGAAGTGKSAAMDALRIAYQDAGRRVTGLALAGKAAAELRTSARIEDVSTLHRFLMDLEPDQESGKPKRRLDNHDVLIIDEAGMVDSRVMAATLVKAEAAGSRIIMVGDYKQLEAVGPGGIFRALAQRQTAAGQLPELTEVRRQRDKELADAIARIRDGDCGKIMDHLIERNLVDLEDQHQDAIARAVKCWYDDAGQGGQWRPAESLLIASTNEDVQELNTWARAVMLRDKRITGITTIRTTAHGNLDIGIGERVVFETNNRRVGVRNGETASVVGIRQGTLQVRRDNDQQLIEVPTETYRHLGYSYAATAHRSQGMTVDRVTWLAGGGALGLAETYVSLSRVRDQARIVFDREALGKFSALAEPPVVALQRAEIIAKELCIKVPETAQENLRGLHQWMRQVQPQRDPKAALRDELKNIAKAMGIERQKESSLDFEPIEITGIPKPPPELEPAQPAGAADWEQQIRRESPVLEIEIEME